VLRCAVLCRPCNATARRLSSGGGGKFQSDLETLWDLVQPLLLDADMEV
jgi:hypothetical protein